MPVSKSSFGEEGRERKRKQVCSMEKQGFSDNVWGP